MWGNSELQKDLLKSSSAYFYTDSKDSVGLKFFEDNGYKVNDIKLGQNFIVFKVTQHEQTQNQLFLLSKDPSHIFGNAYTTVDESNLLHRLSGVELDILHDIAVGSTSMVVLEKGKAKRKQEMKYAYKKNG